MSTHLGRGDIRTSNTQARGINLQVHSAMNHCSFAPIPPGAGGKQTAKQHPTRLSKEPCPRKTCVYSVYTSTQAELNTTRLRLTKASGITTRRRCHLKPFRIATCSGTAKSGRRSRGAETQSLPEESRRTGRH